MGIGILILVDNKIPLHKSNDSSNNDTFIKQGEKPFNFSFFD